MAEFSDFLKLDIRAGTITDAKVFAKARKPAYQLEVDFGAEIGTKKSSAQITDLYTPEDLIGTQVVCCVNLEPMRIGSVKSEVRILGADAKEGVVLLRPTQRVENGDRIF